MLTCLAVIMSAICFLMVALRGPLSCCTASLFIPTCRLTISILTNHKSSLCVRVSPRCTAAAGSLGTGSGASCLSHTCWPTNYSKLTLKYSFPLVPPIFLSALARIVPAPPDGAFEEAGTAVTGEDAVMFAGGEVPANSVVLSFYQ